MTITTGIGLDSSGNSASSTPLDPYKVFPISPQLASTPMEDGGSASYEPIPSPLSFTTIESNLSSEPFSFLNLEEPPAGPPTPPVRVNGTHNRRKKKDRQQSEKTNSFKELRAMNDENHIKKNSFSSTATVNGSTSRDLNKKDSFRPTTETTNTDLQNRKNLLIPSRDQTAPPVPVKNPRNQHNRDLHLKIEHPNSSRIASTTTATASSLSMNNLPGYHGRSPNESQRSVSPYLRNLRYKDMGNGDNQEEIYQSPSYLAQSGGSMYGRLDRTRSYSADDLLDGPGSRSPGINMKPFTDYLTEADASEDYRPVSSVYSEGSMKNKNLFAKKKKVSFILKYFNDREFIYFAPRIWLFEGRLLDKGACVLALLGGILASP